MKIDPTKIGEYTKVQLVNFYVEARDRLGVLEATRRIVGGELVNKMNTDGEVIGDYGVTKTRRYKWKVSLDEARELGATKTTETIDGDALKKLLTKGVKIKHEVTTYPNVREIKSEEARQVEK